MIVQRNLKQTQNINFVGIIKEDESNKTMEIHITQVGETTHELLGVKLKSKTRT